MMATKKKRVRMCFSRGSSNFRLALMSRRRIVKSAMRDDSTSEENDGLVLARNFVV